MRLPVIDRRHKWLAFAAGYIGFCVLYIWTGRVHLGNPVPLAASAIDRRIPYLGWTIWIYHTQFFFLIFSVWMMKRTPVISRTLYGMAAASLIAFAIFFVYPTTVLRPEMTAGAFTKPAFTLLYSIDPPTNCLPSLHVALAWMAASGVYKENRQVGRWAWLWAALISISTLTTRQHYFIDVLAGLSVAGLCGVLAKRMVSAKANHGLDESA